MNNDYYAYIYYDHNHVPFYVGKGTGNRAWIHTHNGYRPINKRLAYLKSIDAKVTIGLYGGLSELEASELETHLIATIGRKCKSTGPLINIAYGGGRPNAAHTPQSKARISATRTGMKY